MIVTCFRTRWAFTKTTLAVMSNSLAISAPGRSRKIRCSKQAQVRVEVRARHRFQSVLEDLGAVQLGPCFTHLHAVCGGGLEHVASPSVQGLVVGGLSPRLVDQRVERQAEQPGAELAPCPVERVDLSEQLHEDVLDDVIRIGLVETLLAQEPEEYRPVDGVELAIVRGPAGRSRQ